MRVYFADGVLTCRIPAFIPRSSGRGRVPRSRNYSPPSPLPPTLYLQPGIRPIRKLDGRIRLPSPPRRSAPWPYHFLVAVKSMREGASLERYRANGSSRRFLSENLAPNMLRLLLEATGAFLSHDRGSGDVEDPCPSGVSFIFGGPRGFAHYVFEKRKFRVSALSDCARRSFSCV